MAYTAPITYVSGAVATAAGMNTYVKDDIAYLKSVVDGTLPNQIPGAALATLIAVPGRLSFVSNDAGGLIFNGAATSNPGYMMSAVDSPYILRNAYFDGTNFQRVDTSKEAWAWNVEGRLCRWAAAGANPITWTILLESDTAGKLTGKGFYRSAEVGIANSATANFTHGLGARPAWVGGFYAASSGTEDSLTNPINVGVGSTGVAITTGAVTSTTITVTNASGAGVAARVYAIL